MPKANILIIEDESAVADDIRIHLEGMGHHVAGIVDCGELALSKTAAMNPDLVLLDVRMKGRMDGIQIAEAIRSLNIPVVFLTAYADEITMQLVRDIDSFGYILRPFEERELSINIDIALYKHQIQSKLHESESRFLTLFKTVMDGLFLLNLQGRIMDVNPSGCTLFGYGRNELLLSDFRMLASPEERAKILPGEDTIERCITGVVVNRMRHKIGAEVWVEMAFAPIQMEGKMHVIGVLRDITSRKKTGEALQESRERYSLVEQQLLHDAFHDNLTGLPNRALLLDRLEHTMKRARRSNLYSFSVLFLDLDRFKVVNDSLGHPMGDHLLINFSQRLDYLLRQSDTVARFGGDEFVILLEECKNPSDPEAVAQRIQEDLQQPFLLNGQPVYISASIGIVSGSPAYAHAEDILRDADIAMYRAKAEGKARHVHFDASMREHAINCMELETDLRLALKRQELAVFYQPILSLGNSKIVGFEALLRWFHPQRGLLLPPEFLPLAEETGFILSIGRWVLAEACRQLRQWQVKFPSTPPLTMSVNISRRQFTQPTFADQVAQTLLAAGVEPGTLKLEITENLLMLDSELIINTMNRLHDLGVQLFIDDFGTGFSSLGYVQKFPISTIKIDKLFINQMSDIGKHAEITHTIVQLANELGLGTIAEGIETSAQLKCLKGMACESGQGWLFSEALTRENTEAYLQKSLLV